MTTPIRVLHVADSAGWAGGETWLLRVASALDRRFRLSVVVPEPGPLVERLRALDVAVHEAPMAARLVNPAALAALVRVFRRVAPAIVQSHGARSNVYVRLAARVARVPAVVSTVHNSLYDYPVGALRRRVYVTMDVATSPLADRIVAVSGAIARDLVERYGLPPAKVVVVRNGIEADAFAAQATNVRARLGLAAGDRVVAVAARMTEQKGHAHLIDALPAIAAAVPGVRCVFAGDGPLRAALEAHARRRGVAGRCLFLGARDDVAAVLASADVVALPSRSEGLPFAVLEAMAVGRPVVATAVGGTPEAIDDGRTGLLVPAGDTAALAAALARLLGDPDVARRMGEQGAARVRREFSLAGMVGALADLYDGLRPVAAARAAAAPAAAEGAGRSGARRPGDA